MRDNGADSAGSANEGERRERRIQQFPETIREHIAALTCCSPEAEDLIESFPGLLVALVSDFGTPNARARAFNTIVHGGSIRLAAQSLALPLWLRRLPPEAFRKPMQSLPDDKQFSTSIASLVPDSSCTSSDWLEQISIASEACSSTFALWVAKHCTAVPPTRRRLLFMNLASWAWHATQPETIGFRLIEKPWSVKMGLRRATEELVRWRRRTELACLLGDGIESAWLENGTHLDYSFKPLITLDDFINESRAMCNCLDQYTDRLNTGLVRIFSIRQGDERVADVEVGPIAKAGGLPSIVQIRGPGNQQVPLVVWRATQHWLASQPINKIPYKPGLVRPSCKEIPAIWRPYLDWLPEARRVEFETLMTAERRNPTRRYLAARPIVRASRVANRHDNVSA
jgi:hypothetical protein